MTDNKAFKIIAISLLSAGLVLTGAFAMKTSRIDNFHTVEFIYTHDSETVIAKIDYRTKQLEVNNLPRKLSDREISELKAALSTAELRADYSFTDPLEPVFIVVVDGSSYSWTKNMMPNSYFPLHRIATRFLTAPVVIAL